MKKYMKALVDGLNWGEIEEKDVEGFRKVIGSLCAFIAIVVILGVIICIPVGIGMLIDWVW